MDIYIVRNLQIERKALIGSNQTDYQFSFANFFEKTENFLIVLETHISICRI